MERRTFEKENSRRGERERRNTLKCNIHNVQCCKEFSNLYHGMFQINQLEIILLPHFHLVFLRIKTRTYRCVAINRKTK